LATYILKMKKLIGRKEEQLLLKDTLESDEAELVAVVGRRRVGKTYLITTVFEEQMVLELGCYSQKLE